MFIVLPITIEIDTTIDSTLNDSPSFDRSRKVKKEMTHSLDKNDRCHTRIIFKDTLNIEGFTR